MLSPRPPKQPAELGREELILEDGAKTPPRKTRARTVQSTICATDDVFHVQL